MLGKILVDEGFESKAGVYPGLGLLDCTTRFASYSKNTTQVRRRAAPVPPILSSMGEVTGDEIHMGVTEPGVDREAFSGDGRVNADGIVFGTYMHGLFLNCRSKCAARLPVRGKKVCRTPRFLPKVRIPTTCLRACSRNMSTWKRS